MLCQFHPTSKVTKTSDVIDCTVPSRPPNLAKPALIKSKLTLSSFVWITLHDSSMFFSKEMSLLMK